MLVKDSKVKTCWGNSWLMPLFPAGKDLSGEKKGLQCNFLLNLYGWYLYALVSMSSSFKVLS